MKKILICLGLMILVSGCGETTNSLQCNRTTTTNGLTTNVTYDIDYLEDDVKYVTITYNYKQDENTTKKDLDGVGTGTDGTTQDDNTKEKDGIVDGVVGNAIDEGINTVTDTILDIAGIRKNYENQIATYDDIEGLEYKIDDSKDTEYTVVYKIDFNKIKDSDLARFNIDRKFTTTKTTYENQGYTCK